MKNKMNLYRSLLVILSLTAFTTFTMAQGWTVPAKNSGMKNPVASSKESLSNGKELWAKHCKSCHGAMGLGDGPKAAALDVPSGDFSSKAFQAQTDGDLFYKVSEGKGKMPGFKKSITDDNDRWALVNYMRTMKGK
jgi:mono/diheme cytochrome c family protein